MESEIFAIDGELMVGPDNYPCISSHQPIFPYILIQVGPGCDLFDYIATCLDSFMEGHGLEGTSLPLGFTFSFPLIQVP